MSMQLSVKFVFENREGNVKLLQSDNVIGQLHFTQK